MNRQHPTREQLARYVVAALPAGAAEAVERHVGACPRCADALADEARFEMALLDAIPDLRPAAAVVPLRPTRPAARASRVFGAVSTFAAAAGLLLAVWSGTGVDRHMPLAGMCTVPMSRWMSRAPGPTLASAPLCDADELPACLGPAVCR